MGLLQKFFGVSKQQATKLLNSTWQIIWGDANFRNETDIWGELDDKQRMQTQKVHAVVFACLRVLGQAFSEAELQVGEFDEEGKWSNATDPRVLDLIQNPNPHLTGSEFCEYWIYHIHLTGKSFIWKWRSAMGIEELWPVPPNWVNVIPLETVVDGDNRRVIGHYEVTPPGRSKPIRVEVEDMIYSRFIDPLNFVDGVGSLQAAYRDFKMDIEKDNYIIEMLLNLKVPGVVFKQTQDWDKPQKDELREALDQQVGRGRRGSPLFIGGENVAVELIAPLKDLDWPGLSALSESRICAAFGVPPLLVHNRSAMANTPLSSPNLSAAQELFYTTTMMGLWTKFADVVTKGLLRNEGMDQPIQFRFNVTDVKALQPNMLDVSKVALDSLMKGAVQVNEARSKMGLEPDPELEGIYYLPAGVIPVRAQDIAGIVALSDDEKAKHLEDSDVLQKTNRFQTSIGDNWLPDQQRSRSRKGNSNNGG